MSAPSARRVIVVGAGAFGSSIALVLAQAGHKVRLIEAAPEAANASSVAAGMLAPAFEALLDPLSHDHFELLRQARDAWPAFVQRLGGAGVGLRRSGALWLGPEHAAALARLGAEVEFLSAERLRALAPSVVAREGVFTPEDWRLDPRAALSASLAAAREAGVEVVTARVTAVGPGAVTLEDGERLAADAVVLATGPGGLLLAPELAQLSPIKGHILTYAASGFSADTPVIRADGGYGVVDTSGVRVGATMQAGQADRAIEPEVVAGLHAVASGLFPALENVAPVAHTGVRATTADGLPLVGPSSLEGVFLAVGARRNGWLLAPMTAAMIAAQIAGEDAGSLAARFNARRFERP